jgi:hypothetical protein
MLLSSPLINAPVYRHPPQPIQEVLLRFNCPDLLVQLQKDLLGYVLRQRSVLQIMDRNAEHHGLISTDEFSKCGSIALKRAAELGALVQIRPLLK